MSDIYVVGVSMTPFGKFLDKSVKDLTREAVLGALAAVTGTDRGDQTCTPISCSMARWRVSRCRLIRCSQRVHKA